MVANDNARQMHFMHMSTVYWVVQNAGQGIPSLITGVGWSMEGRCNLTPAASVKCLMEQLCFLGSAEL